MDKRNELLKLAAAKIIVNNTRPQMRASNEVVKLAAAKILRHRFPELRKMAWDPLRPGDLMSNYAWSRNPGFVSNSNFNYGRDIVGANGPDFWRPQTQVATVSPNQFDPVATSAALGGRAVAPSSAQAASTAAANAPKVRARDWFFGTRGNPSLKDVFNASPNAAAARTGAGALGSIAKSPFGKLTGTALAAWALLPLLQGKGAFNIRALGGKSREDEMMDRQQKQYERAMQMAEMGQMAQMLGQGGQTFNNAMGPMYGLSSQFNPYFNYRPGARQVGR